MRRKARQMLLQPVPEACGGLCTACREAQGWGRVCTTYSSLPTKQPSTSCAAGERGEGAWRAGVRQHAAGLRSSPPPPAQWERGSTPRPKAATAAFQPGTNGTMHAHLRHAPKRVLHRGGGGQQAAAHARPHVAALAHRLLRVVDHLTRGVRSGSGYWVGSWEHGWGAEDSAGLACSLLGPCSTAAGDCPAAGRQRYCEMCLAPRRPPPRATPPTLPIDPPAAPRRRRAARGAAARARCRR